MAVQDIRERKTPAEASFLNDPKVRSIFLPGRAVVLALISGVWWIVGQHDRQSAALQHLVRFRLSHGRAGFDICDSLIAYHSDSTYGRALLVGLLNTILVAITGIITATIIGFIIGVGRLSRNWLIRKICMVYVEIFRNIPPLLVIFFWYFGVLSVLPLPRDSIDLPFGSYLNSRGFYFPAHDLGRWFLADTGGVRACHRAWRRSWRAGAQARQMATGQQFPVFWTSLALIVGLSAAWLCRERAFR